MGFRLVDEVIKNAARLRLTTGERWGLAVLASDANDGTRLTYHHANDPEILREAGVAPDAWRNVRTALVRKRVLEVVVPGRRGRASMYRIPELAVLPHPADAEQPSADLSGPSSRPMTHPGGAESLSDGASLTCAIEGPMTHPTGAESGPNAHPRGAESTGAPISSSFPPRSQVSGHVPPARAAGAAGADEEGEASPNPEHLKQAIAIMEGLHRLPLTYGTTASNDIAREIARRLASGWTEDEMCLRLDAPLPPAFPGSPEGFLAARVRKIPLRRRPPQTTTAAVPTHAEVGERLGGVFARTGERPDAVDVGAIGWREIMRQRQEGA